MERNRVEELIKKYNARTADATEMQLLERFLESGEVSIEQLEDVNILQDKFEQIDNGSPSLQLDDHFYTMLTNEKRKEKKFTFSLPTWSAFLPKLSFAVSFTILGFFMAYFFINRTAAPEVKQLTQEVSDLKEMMMLSLLEKESATDRLRAVSLTDEMQQASKTVTEALIKTLNKDANINVRLAALEALKPYVGDSSVRMALVRSIAQQESPLIQVAMAELMAAIQEKHAVKELEKMLENNNTPEEVKRRIQKNLEVLI
ncbi:anti-sigma factor [Chryseotalea sanaruensis]|uniref:Anti-sigma factor n=1 Tax=Chryseotalea sanaruensis TaxID=2482724 RepID=A0A401UAL7_9BACT|nr:HEAT repeat domain-containing protein [Chryseotalea sanaruensis]GCC51953.1 anti-sigma factor [Chryseotalea sanaruensis]